MDAVDLCEMPGGRGEDVNIAHLPRQIQGIFERPFCGREITDKLVP